MSKRNYVIFTLMINGVVPWGIYIWLSNYMNSIVALSVATMVPLLDNLIHFIKYRTCFFHL